MPVLFRSAITLIFLLSAFSISTHGSEIIEEQEITALINKLDQATENADIDFINNILAEDFIVRELEGQQIIHTADKNTFMEGMKTLKESINYKVNKNILNIYIDNQKNTALAETTTEESFQKDQTFVKGETRENFYFRKDNGKLVIYHADYEVISFSEEALLIYSSPSQ